MIPKDLFRFWAKVNKNGPVHPALGTRCWLWTASVDKKGYGQFTLNKKNVRAHRLSWFIKYGKWPEPNALHKCDVTRCIRPEHLFEGTQQMNISDKMAKGRHRSGGVSGVNRGVSNGSAVLSDAKVRRMRLLYCKGNTSYRKLAIKFGVNNVTARDVVLGNHWKHV